MPRVLAFVLLLISLTVGAAEPNGFVLRVGDNSTQNPKGFVLKGAFVETDGSIHTMYFPGEGKVVVFKTEELCNVVKDNVDAVLKEKAPEMQYLQVCIPTPEGLVRGVEKRPEA